MRLMAVRRSVIALPPRLKAAEFAILSSRAASAGSEPITRTTWSVVVFSSASTLRTRIATSGNDGSSTLPFESSAARPCTNTKASTFEIAAFADTTLPRNPGSTRNQRHQSAAVLRQRNLEITALDGLREQRLRRRGQRAHRVDVLQSQVRGIVAHYELAADV